MPVGPHPVRAILSVSVPFDSVTIQYGGSVDGVIENWYPARKTLVVNAGTFGSRKFNETELPDDVPETVITPATRSERVTVSAACADEIEINVKNEVETKYFELFIVSPDTKILNH